MEPKGRPPCVIGADTVPMDERLAQLERGKQGGGVDATWSDAQPLPKNSLSSPSPRQQSGVLRVELTGEGEETLVTVVIDPANRPDSAVVVEAIQRAVQAREGERTLATHPRPPSPYSLPQEVITVLEASAAFLGRLDASQVLPSEETAEALALRRIMERTLAKHVYKEE